MFLIFNKLLALDLIRQMEMIDEDLLKIIFVELMELEEIRKKVVKTMELHQEHVKRYFDKNSVARMLREGEIVLKWDEERTKPGKHTIFDSF